MVLKILVLLVIIFLGYLVAQKAIPWVVTKIGRALGFRMKPTPLTERRVQRFRRIKRGYWSFLFITTAFVLSWFLELYVNDKPLYIRYGDQSLYPAVADWLDNIPFVDLQKYTRAASDDFGLQGKGVVPYRDYAAWVRDPSSLEAKAAELEAKIPVEEAKFRKVMKASAEQQGTAYDPEAPLPPFKEAEFQALRDEATFFRSFRKEVEDGKASIVMPLYPFNPRQQLLELPGVPPHAAFSGKKGMPLLGTDFEGKDVLSQLLYGFRIAFAFALVVAFIGFSIGIAVGATMGYFGGWVDIVVQRIIEIWSSIPFLFTLMIIASIYQPGFLLLAFMLVALRAWLGITYTIRGEYYREKARDYVQAARAIGARSPKIMARHIFPNALVPVVTFMPFAIVAYIGSLVSLDFLGFGLPAGTPSWGKLLSQGAENVTNHPQLVYWPILAFAGTLFCVVMVGEAVREAFDPKLYSRLR